MAKPPIIEIADAIVTEVNAGSWSQSFTATREYAPPAWTPGEAATLRVTVMPFSIVKTLNTRGFRTDMMEIAIGVEKQVDATDSTTIDSLAYLVDEIANFYAMDATNKGHRLVSGRPTASIVSANIVPFYSVDDLRTHNKFFSQVLLDIQESYRV